MISAQTKKETAGLTAIAPQFVVKDVVKAAEYYRDVLGFEVLGYFLDPPVYAMVRRDGAEIHFGKQDCESQSNSIPRKIGLDAYIWTTDVDALYEELKSNGADIVEKLSERVYGSREFAIKDCYGFKLGFGD